MKRWAISLVVMVALLVTIIPLVSGEPMVGGKTSGDTVGPATDGGWAQVNTDGFDDLYNRRIVKGYPDGAFGPSNQVTRAELQTIQPTDLVYLGAFRLPGGDIRPETFAYGGNAMTFNPSGDPSGPGDGFPGSLFVTGHDRLAYGELPNGSQVAEISIPVPVISDNLANLSQAEFIQGFCNVAEGYFEGLDEIPRIGMQYLNHSATGAKIHLAWGQHFQPDPPVASHAWFDPNLSAPDMQGTWFIGNQSLYSVNGYMFEIPASWADEHAGGRYLATGRFRDGGWSGMGPALFACRPWIDDAGTPAPSGTHLEETVLLLYESSENTSDIERCLDSYQHPDEWEGGAWITTSTGKSAVLFAGTKATGTKYWYGWANPAGSEYPCVEEELVGQFTLCRLADGTPRPPEDLTECEGHNDYRGWWSSRFDAQFILYNPADLAQVAAGAMESWEPQPYASVDIDEHLFLNPAGIEQDMLGTGVQRAYRIGAVAYDRDNDLLYVLELFADEAKPVVHVWRVYEGQQQPPFTDLSPGDWFFEAVMNLYNRGIISGYPDGTFGPSNQVTRAEFATMLVRAMGWAIDTSGLDFPDVPSTHWAYGFVKTARNRGMVSGYPDGTFRPDNPISRAEIATMIVRAMGWAIDTSGPNFPDVPSTHWAYGFIKTARNHGVVSGYPDGTFKPDNPSTRAEAAAMIYRALP